MEMITYCTKKNSILQCHCVCALKMIKYSTKYRYMKVWTEAISDKLQQYQHQ